MTYKRLTREIAVPAGGGDLTFWTSYDTEPDWDFLAVEARTAGGNDWTTLPDAERATRPARTRARAARGSTAGAGGRAAPAPDALPDARPRQPGDVHAQRHQRWRWNAATGSSNGWQQWTIDLNSYAGKTVEISVAYISDWGTQNLGVFLDDFAWPGGSTSFEGTDTGGWQITGPPAGSGANANNFAVTDAGGFPVGAAITTPEVDPDGLRVRDHLHRGPAQGGDGPGRGPPVAVDARVQPAAASAAAGPLAASFEAAQRNLFP